MSLREGVSKGESSPRSPSPSLPHSLIHVLTHPRATPYVAGIPIGNHEGRAFEKTRLFCIFVKFAT